MKKIFIIGAGRSSSSLIKYLLDHSAEHNWQITVGDVNPDSAKAKIEGYANARAIAFDMNDEKQREEQISDSDIVISMLPAFLHVDVAKDCVRLKKHMATASYVSDAMRELDAEAKKNGTILLNEAGLDPGIDHASAMKAIDEIKHKGGKITSFKSYCGGLVAPESNDNPWGYKFSWNPRNVILAGQGTAQFQENGKLKFIPYNRLFTQTDTIEVDGYGSYDAYANRDSIGYKEPYGLQDIKTMLRGTLRMPGYCKAWNVFVKLGLTDDSYKIHEADKLNYTQLLEAFLPEGSESMKEKLQKFMADEMDAEVMRKLEWLELFDNKPITLKEGSPAQLLQDLLEKKWLLKEHDKDMIVMQHQFEYILNGKTHKLNSSLVVKGEDQVHTAMAKTVGLPLAIIVRMILTGSLQLSGVQIPTHKMIYEPLLTELERFDVKFVEKEI
ncbi:MAG: saccharopine dehydrogenase family protein [Bacteroidia bacterium]